MRPRPYTRAFHSSGLDSEMKRRKEGTTLLSYFSRNECVDDESDVDSDGEDGGSACSDEPGTSSSFNSTELWVGLIVLLHTAI